MLFEEDLPDKVAWDPWDLVGFAWDPWDAVGFLIRPIIRKILIPWPPVGDAVTLAF